jgi:hypothetical protein
LAGNASSGFSLQPINEYMSFSTSLGLRTVIGAASDIGAYENTTGFGINESGGLKSTITIYPNPATNRFSIQMNNEWRSSDLKIVIYDVSGKAVKEVLISETKTNVDLNNELKSGIYFYCIEDNDLRIDSGKLILE